MNTQKNKHKPKNKPKNKLTAKIHRRKKTKFRRNLVNREPSSGDSEEHNEHLPEIMNQLDIKNDKLKILLIVPGRGGSFLTRSWFNNNEKIQNTLKKQLSIYDIIINTSIDIKGQFLEKNSRAFSKCKRNIIQEQKLSETSTNKRLLYRPRFINKCLDHICHNLNNFKIEYSIDILAYSEGVGNILEAIGQYKEFAAYSTVKSNWITKINHLVLNSGCILSNDTHFFKQIVNLQKKSHFKISIVETGDTLFGGLGYNGSRIYNNFSETTNFNSYIIPKASHGFINIEDNTSFIQLHIELLSNILYDNINPLLKSLSIFSHDKYNSKCKGCTIKELYEFIYHIFTDRTIEYISSTTPYETNMETYDNEFTKNHHIYYLKTLTITNIYSEILDAILLDDKENEEIANNELNNILKKPNTDIRNIKQQLEKLLDKYIKKQKNNELQEQIDFYTKHIDILDKFIKTKINANLAKQTDFPPTYYEGETPNIRIRRILILLDLKLKSNKKASILKMIEDKLEYKSNKNASYDFRVLELSKQLQDMIDSKYIDDFEYDDFPDELYNRESVTKRIRRIAAFLEVKYDKDNYETIFNCYEKLDMKPGLMSSNIALNVKQLSRFVEIKRRESKIPLVIKNIVNFDDNRLINIFDKNELGNIIKNKKDLDTIWLNSKISTTEDMQYKLFEDDYNEEYTFIGDKSDFDNFLYDESDEIWEESHYINMDNIEWLTEYNSKGDDEQSYWVSPQLLKKYNIV